MIFSKYKETCEVLLDYPKIGGGDIVENDAKKSIRNLLHANIDVHIRRLIAEFPKYGINCIEKFQSHCANMTFSEQSLLFHYFLQNLICCPDLNNQSVRIKQINIYDQ